MDWIDRLKDDVNSIALWLLGSLVAFGLWVARTVLTDRARVNAIEDTLNEIQKNVRLLTRSMIDDRNGKQPPPYPDNGGQDE